MSQGTDHQCSVTLTVVGADLDPDAVSAALRLEPDQTWRRGERKSCIRRDGTTHLFDSIHDEGGWKKFIPDCYRGEPLYRQVGLWLARLGTLGGPLRELRGRGWVPELDCFAAGSEVLVLSNDEVRSIADLGVDLGITLASGSPRTVEESDRSASE